MSTSKETTSSVNEAAPLSASNETETSLDKKVVMAKKFDKEMKDYAKATVKEFLGIYGYEEDVDINMEDASEGTTTSQSESSCSNKNPQTESNLKRPANRSPCEAISSAASTVTSIGEKRTSASPVTSVSISSSTNNGNAAMTRFCMTMSIPRNGADSGQGFTTLRFWNCIMCSTAFVGCKPEIVQRAQHPHLFTFQPEWLSHAGICSRCQNTLAMNTPKITIYAINEPPRYHHSYIHPPASVPVMGHMCNAVPGQCNCAGGVHGHTPGIVPMVFSETSGQNLSLGANMPVVDVKTEAVPGCTEVGFTTRAAHGMTEQNYIFRPITCSQ